MKKLWSVQQLSLRSITAFCLAILLFTACKKDDVFNNERTPAAGLMAFNLSPDVNAVGYTLSGNYLTNTALNYTNYTGQYLPVYIGNREVRAFDYGTGSTIATSNVSLQDSMYYSTFLLGGNGSYRNVTVKDDLQPLTVASGKAWVRYINAVADSSVVPTATISNGSETGISQSAPYASVSSFKQVSAGSVTATINGGSISASRTVTLEENKVYTILYVGLPNATDTEKKVQIKYITNGIVTP